MQVLFLTCWAVSRNIGMYALDSAVANAGASTFLCRWWSEPGCACTIGISFHKARIVVPALSNKNSWTQEKFVGLPSVWRFLKISEGSLVYIMQGLGVGYKQTILLAAKNCQIQAASDVSILYPQYSFDADNIPKLLPPLGIVYPGLTL
jgi:hypothetical protein